MRSLSTGNNKLGKETFWLQMFQQVSSSSVPRDLYLRYVKFPNLSRTITLEGRTTHGHLVEYYAQRPKVHRLIVFVAFDHLLLLFDQMLTLIVAKAFAYLGCHVLDGAAEIRRSLAIDFADAEAKVNKFDMSLDDG